MFKNTDKLNSVEVNKCCEKDEIYKDQRCTKVEKFERWAPLFISETGQQNSKINYT